MDKFEFGSKPPPPQGPGKSRWKNLYKNPLVILLVTVLLIAGVLTLSVNRIMITLLHSRPEVVVPDLEGKPLVEALGLVSTLGLSLKQERDEFDEGLPAGTVLTQHPPSGMQVRRGRAIQVVVSKGGQGVFIPNVIGRPLPEAQSLIQTERLQLGAVSQSYSIDVNEGLILSQDPSSGTVVTRGTLIDLEVSRGLPPSGTPLVPDFTGQSIRQARDWVEGVGGTMRVTEDESAVGVAGAVVRQLPKAGQPLLERETIHLTVVPLASAAGERIKYQVPGDRSVATVRIVVRDSRGESQIYKGAHKGGEALEFPIAVTSATRVRVYLDDLLVDERVLEP